jgi:hypothetical protein
MESETVLVEREYHSIFAHGYLRSTTANVKSAVGRRFIQSLEGYL